LESVQVCRQLRLWNALDTQHASFLNLAGNTVVANLMYQGSFAEFFEKNTSEHIRCYVFDVVWKLVRKSDEVSGEIEYVFASV
jgi:hypothetical protein